VFDEGNLMAVLSDEEMSELRPKTTWERYLADQLQQMLVDKKLQDKMFGAIVFRKDDSDESDLVVVSMHVEDLDFESPHQILPFFLEGTKKFGAPKIDGTGKMVGVLLIHTGCRLVGDGEIADAYREIRESEVDVWLQDFPGAQKTRMAVLGTGEKQIYLATMSEDEQGVQAFDPVIVAPVKVELATGRSDEDEENGIGGGMVEAIDELAALFRKENG